MKPSAFNIRMKDTKKPWPLQRTKNNTEFSLNHIFISSSMAWVYEIQGAKDEGINLNEADGS